MTEKEEALSALTDILLMGWSAFYIKDYTLFGDRRHHVLLYYPTGENARILEFDAGKFSKPRKNRISHLSKEEIIELIRCINDN